MSDNSHNLPPDIAAFLREELGDETNNAPPTFTVEGPIWIWTGTGKDGEPAKGSWYFLSIIGEVAAAIRTASVGRSGGWGSVKVEATIGKTIWHTSLFPSQSVGGYLLPLKAAVRKTEKISEGDMIIAALNLA